MTTNFPILALTKQEDGSVSCSAGFIYELLVEHDETGYYKCTFRDCKAKLSLKKNGCLEGRLIEPHCHGVEGDESETSSIEMVNDGEDLPPPYLSVDGESPTAQIFIEASLKVGSEESPKIRKTVQFDVNHPKELSAVIEDCFYNDSAWDDSECYAVAEKKSENSEEFESVLAKYDTVFCEDGAKYKIVFYEAASVSKKLLSKFLLKLSPRPSTREEVTSPSASKLPQKPKIDEAVNHELKSLKIDDPSSSFGECLVTVYCDGNQKFKKNIKFDSSEAPSMLSLAAGFCNQVYQSNKQIVASYLEFDCKFDDFVNVDSTEVVKNGKRYEIKFEENDDVVTDNSHKSIVRHRKVDETTNQIGKAIIEAVFKDGAKESGSHEKIVTVNASKRRLLMGYIMAIFYEETTWCKEECYVVVQKYDNETEQFDSMTTCYEDVKVAIGDKFKIQFLKVSSLTKSAKKRMCQFAVLLEKESDAESSASSSSPEEPANFKVLVDTAIKSAPDCVHNIQNVISFDKKPLTLLNMIVDTYETHVKPMQPAMQFSVIASRYDDSFHRSVNVDQDYATVNVADKESYAIEFVNASLVQHKTRFGILIPKEMASVPAPKPKLAPKPVAAVPTSHKALIEATYQTASSESPKFAKMLSFEATAPYKLIAAVMTVFYNDTQWGKRKCYASVAVKVDGFDDFLNVLSDYEETSLEDKGKYRVVFYDAKDFLLDSLPKYCVPLDGTEEEQAAAESDEGVLSSDDEMEGVLSDEEQAPEMNLVKFEGAVQRKIDEPKMKVLLEVACPKKCTNSKRKWICSDCHQPVFYAFSDYLHCSCGAHSNSDAKFKCGSTKHGTFYQTLALNVYKSIGKCEEINIILMGETGAGKSTWIDAIFNYLLHASLDEAVDKGTLEIPIPTHFLLEDDNKKLKKIYVGTQTDNENQTSGASATQRPKSYTFMRNGKFYRFIDVPGVGDSRGVEQDRKNFEMILQELYNFDRIHAVCILIPADAPRLTIAMKYCINELLTHLHQDAAKNLVFCFTKARVNFYKAGNTQEILENYVKSFKEKRNVQISLNENTMYYFDNESFKFLCALQNGINLWDDKQDFVKSWDISAMNSYRILDYIASLQPHMIRDMISLNEAKRIILELTPISAEITKNIQTNKRIIEAKKVELQEMKKQTVSLKEQLTIKQTTLVAVPINYPKTVCASAECVDTVGIPGTTESQVLYRTICHDHCYLQNIEPGKYPNPGLQHCAAMTGMNCHQCGCSWDTHLHIRYEQKQETIDVPNKEVEKVISGKNTDEVSVTDVIKGLETRLDELSLKEKRIKTICAKFVAFLNKNAIAVINDAYGEYLEQSIKLAKNEVAVTGEGSEKVDQLEKYLAEYKEEVSIINDHINSGLEDITITSIEAMKEELKGMDELGAQFTSFLNAADHSQKNYVREDEVHLYKPTNGGLISSVFNMVKGAYEWTIGKKEEAKPPKKAKHGKHGKQGKKGKK